jgi:nucleoside-diphosphate-sugar epimerase
MLEAAVARAIAAGDRHIAVTGAGGWLGLATLDLLERALGPAFATRVSCYGSAPRLLDLGGGRQVAQRALTDLAALDARHVWLLHFAFQTKDRAETMDEGSYRAANRAIADTVLAALDRIDAQAVFVASSGAATRADDPAASAAMRLYGQMKRDDEARFADWAESRGRRAVIGRVFNVSGPYINKHQAYALASFILDALAGRPIAVNAPRPVIRGYVAIRELMSLVFALLEAASDGVVRFDTGGEGLELADVAAAVDAALGGRGVTRAAIVETAEDRYVGDAASWRHLLDEHGIVAVPLHRQIVETADHLRNPTT